MMSGSFKVVFVSAIYPHPIDTGKKVVVSGMLDYLRQRVGADDLAYVYVGEAPTAEKARSLGAQLICLQLPGVLRRLWNVLWHSVVRRDKSIQEALVYSPKTRSDLHQLMDRASPELIIFDTVRMSQFGLPSGYTGQNSVYLEDLFSVRYERMLAAMTGMGGGYSDVLGNFAKFVPARLRPLVQKSRWFQKLLLNSERVLVRSSERNAARQFSANLLLNEDEVELLQSEVPDGCVKVIRPYLPALELGRAPQRNFHGAPVFVFLGALNLAHNEVGLLAFLERAFPEVLRTVPNVKLLVVGRNASKRLEEAAAAWGDAVQLQGFVPDLRGLLSGCCAMIIPMTIGSGVKLKTIEALAYGVPFVSTPLGVESVPVTSGEHCIISQLEEFPQHMRALMDVTANQRMSDSAHRLFAEHYSKEAIFKQYDRLFPAVGQPDANHSGS
jgi:glycosyltransferase involved in cell wall biosynthesis